MVNTLNFYSLKASERTRNPMKVHAIDLGLRKVASLSASTDENCIGFVHIKRYQKSELQLVVLNMQCVFLVF